MEPLAFLHDKIPDFPGYDTEEGRRLADEDVRSYLGEALADLTARLNPPAPLDARAADLMVRAGFTNQRVHRQFEDGARNSNDFASIAAADAAVVELADAAQTVDAGGLGAYLDRAGEALDRREAAMLAYGQAATAH